MASAVNTAVVLLFFVVLLLLVDRAAVHWGVAPPDLGHGKREWWERL